MRKNGKAENGKRWSWSEYSQNKFYDILKKLIKYYKTSAICSYRRSEFSSQHPYLGISKLLITSVPGDLKLSFGP